MSSEPPIDGVIDLSGGPSSAPLRVNGNSAPAAMVSAPGDELHAVSWYPSYDRATVERYLASLDAERARLEAEIAAAERRTAAAQAAVAARNAELETGLGAVVLAAQSEVNRIEQEQAAAVAAIRAEADAEAARIREAARMEVQVVRDASASLSALARPHTDAADPVDAYRAVPDRTPQWPPPTQGWTDAG